MTHATTRNGQEMDKSLSELLNEVDALFPASKKPYLATYNYSLGRFPFGWNFQVTNNWYEWSKKKLKYEFGVWPTPEVAVEEFLTYVKKNKINVKGLCDRK